MLNKAFETDCCSSTSLMCVYCTVTIPPEKFVLGHTLRTHPSARIELERAVLFDRWLSPYLWITNADDGFEATVEAEPDVDRLEVVDRTDDELLARIRWRNPDRGLVRTLVETDAICLQCTGVNNAWHLTLRFPSSAKLAECYERCRDEDRNMAVKSVRSGDRSDARRLALTLSDAQREAICTALECGYFSVPRQVTLQELAERLDVSDTAASQRIRRGLEALLTDAFPGVHPDGETTSSHSTPSY